MYEVRVDSVFRASHALRLPTGQMESPHDHDWHVQVVLGGNQLDEAGMLVDFASCREKLSEVLAPLENANLNEHPLLRGVPATAENVAQRLFDLLKIARWGRGRLTEVVVHEAPGCSCSFGLLQRYTDLV